ncbi:MAG: hypothetical protein L0K01_12155 [Brachybacterium sp.]|nr:hypothetical protein [Brachybacterium sp.]
MDRFIYRIYRQNLHRPLTPPQPSQPTIGYWFTAAPIRLLAWYLTTRK